ncbi:MAG: ribonuclease III [Deltaproteobacteria bacterium]|nr:ribonuclease III [Sandaracinaceae bacterium]MCX7807953.1 ribonuclease III [Deltaproteobacteria bacterium]MDW8245647.1 ribonuclease III [Sandaracinaceae bacterium]
MSADKDNELRLFIQRVMGIEPKRIDLFRLACTHASFANERPDLAKESNEVLEFLGDAVIGLAASLLLHQRFPRAREGELSKRRAELVCKASLAQVAESVGLPPHLRLGRSEEQFGGRRNARLLASTLEALAGALLLEEGVEVATQVAMRLLEPFVGETTGGLRDHKSRLQEWLQSRKKGIPSYQLVASRGPEHDQWMRVVVLVEGKILGEGEGRTRLEAEQEAARQALSSLLEGEQENRPTETS